MNQTWQDLVQKFNAPPLTITETVDRIIAVLDEQDKAAIASMPQTALINLHFSLGLAIRNAFGYWGDKSPLLNALPSKNPDDLSEQIILALWQTLNNRENQD